MLLRGYWKEDSISSVYEEKKKKGVRQGYRKRQMEGGVESKTDWEGKGEKEKREGALWGT